MRSDSKEAGVAMGSGEGEGADERWTQAALLLSEGVEEAFDRECWLCSERIAEALAGLEGSLGLEPSSWGSLVIERLQGSLSDEARDSCARSGVARVWFLIADADGAQAGVLRSQMERWAAEGLALGPARVRERSANFIFEKECARALEAMSQRRDLERWAQAGAKASLAGRI